MDDDKKGISGDNYLSVMEGFADGAGDELMTDPEALRHARDSEQRGRAVDYGVKLRARREEKGFSLKEVAAKTDISERLLGRVESGETFLPLGQLIRLTKSLSMRMTDVISTGEKSYTIVHPEQRETFSRFGDVKQQSHGYEYQSLAPQKKDRVMEPFLVTLHPAGSEEPSSHEGQEFIYVIEGEVDVMIENTREVLTRGDTIYYDSTLPHLVKAHGANPARILAVLTG
jgi:transcriptional regulator with XRE-family HTH domain